MSNEELAERIQQGEREYIPVLWKQVERFIGMKAMQYAKNISERVADYNDLKQSGYFAMLNAVKYFDGKAKFLTYLSNTLKTSFREVAGIRSSRREPSLFAVSLDAPVAYDADALCELIKDEQAEKPFFEVEEKIYMDYVNTVLNDALVMLDIRARKLIELIYFHKQTFRKAFDLAGYPSYQAAERAHYNALRKIRYSSKSIALRRLLYDFGDFDIESEGMKGSGLMRFRETWESATERTAIRLFKGEML